jgi:hypothetical protein
MAETSPAMTLKFNALFVMPQMTRWKLYSSGSGMNSISSPGTVPK